MNKQVTVSWVNNSSKKEEALTGVIVEIISIKDTVKAVIVSENKLYVISIERLTVKNVE